MKPEVKQTASMVIELATKQGLADTRIGGLENKTEGLVTMTAKLSQPRPHDCINANKINELNEDSKQNALGVAEAKRDLAANSTDIDELKQGQSKFIYWLLGAAVIVIGSVVGWYASYKVTTNEVGHLSNEQTKIRTNLEELQMTTKNIPSKVDDAAQRLETAARKIKTDGHDKNVQLDDVWCIMSDREKTRLRRHIPDDKIPGVRCR